MLRLRRKFGQSIVINTEQGDVEITVDRATGNACFLLITAPREINIRRKELKETDPPEKEYRSGQEHELCCCDCESVGTSNFWRVPKGDGTYKAVCHICREKYIITK